MPKVKNKPSKSSQKTSDEFPGNERQHGKPRPVDVHVGNQLKIRRIFLGLTQGTLAEELGITFQQVQKYERGTNRIGASRLYHISCILDVPVSYFFEGLKENIVQSSPSESEQNFASNESVKLLRAYYTISDPEIRKSIYVLLRSIGSNH